MSICLSNWGVNVIFSLDGKYEELSLVDGKTYYSSVKACDGAGFCSSIVTSDGLLVDNSPPIPGHVVDSISGEDKQYQRDRYLFITNS